MIDYRIARTIEHRCKMCFSHSHADSHAHAGAQRTRRRFYTDRVAVFRMARRQGTHLTELFHIVHCQAITEEVQQRIQHGRTMAARKNKAVAVCPLRILRIMVHMVCPKLIGYRCTAKRQARMTGFCLLDSVCGQNANRIDAFGIDVTQNISPLTI